MTITGSAYKRGSVWYAIIRLPDSDTGSKKQKWIKLDLPPSSSKRTADRACQELVARLSGHDIKYSLNIPFTDWLDQWLDHKEPSIEQTTFESYKDYINNHIKPYFSVHQNTLQKLTGRDIQQFYDKLSNDGLSANSIKRYHTVMNQSLQWAYKQGILIENPASRAEVPKGRPRSNGSVLNVAEVAKMLEAFHGDKIYPAVFLAVYYGLRREEVLGLQWSNIDLDNRTFHICTTVTRNRTLVIKDTPKNKSSIRTLCMTDDTLLLFQGLWKQQAEYRLAGGADYQISDWVFTHEDGRLFTPEYLSSRFHKLLLRNKLPLIRFHDLRHTAATLLLANGEDMVDVKNTLGHSTISITVDLYGHVTKASSVRTAAKMEQLIKLPG